jgi:hypothetical protein
MQKKINPAAADASVVFCFLPVASSELEPCPKKEFLLNPFKGNSK